MLKGLKDEAVKRAAHLMLSNSALQSALKRAINLRADLRDDFERKVDGMAQTLSLATTADLKSIKRSIRNLEQQVAALGAELEAQKTGLAELAARVDGPPPRPELTLEAPVEAAPSKGARTAAKKPKKLIEG